MTLQDNHDQEKVSRQATYAAIIQQSLDGVVIVDKTGSILEWNQAQADMTGLTSEYCLGKKIWTIQHASRLDHEKTPETLTELKALFGDILTAEDSPYFGQLVPRDIKHQDGSVHHIESMVYPIRTENDFMLGSVTRDLTEIQAARQKVYESEEKYRSLYENAPLSFQSLDSEGNFLDVNPMWLTTLGYDRDQVIGKWYGDFLHPNWKPKFEERFPKFKALGYVHDVHFKIRHEQGHYLDILFEGCIITNPDGSFKQTYCVFKDITDQKWAEEELYLSEQLYRGLYNSTGLGVGVYDLEGQVISFNEIALSHIGKTLADVKGKTISDLFPPPEAATYEARLQSALSVNHSESYEDKIELETGTYWYLTLYSVVKNEEGATIGVQVVSSNITKIKESQRVLEEAERIANVGSWKWEIPTNKIFWSDEMYRINGRRKAAGPPQMAEYKDHIHTDDIEAFEADLAEALAGNSPASGEYRIIQEDTGATRTIKAEGEVHFSSTGQPLMLVGSVQDVTEQREHEAELRLSELRFEHQFNSSPIPSFIWSVKDGDFYLSEYNDAVVELTQGEAEKFMGLKASDIYPDRPDLMERFTTCMDQKTSLIFESHHTTRGTGLQRVIIFTFAYIDEHYLLMHTQDITERKHAEDELKRVNLILEETGKIAKVGGWEIDFKTQETIIDEQTRSIYEIPSGAKLTIEKGMEYYHDEAKAQITQVVQDALEKQIPYDIEVPFITAKDRHIWVRTQGRVRVEDGQATKLYGTIQDITERKEAENAIKKSEEQLRAIFDNSLNAIMVADDAGNYLSANDSASSMFGYSQEELLAMNVGDLRVVTGPDSAQQYADYIEKGEQSGEYQFYRKDGAERTAQYHAVRVRKDFNLSILTDISEEKQHAAERLALQERLHQSQKLEAVGTMIGGIAHDFNNLIQSILLYSEVVQSQIPEGSEMAEDFDHILTAVGKARHLVKQILTFSRNSQVELNPEVFHELVTHELEVNEMSVPEHITLVKQISSSPDQVLCDRTQINQLLMNLINNAVHAIGDQPGEIRINVATVDHVLDAGTEPQPLMELRVQDNGIGMDTETMKQVFNPFFTTKGVGKGTGLGLSTVHGIVKKMNGRIDIDSRPGQGATFRILFPICEAPGEIELPLVLQDTPMSTGQRVLLVDDELPILNAAAKILSRAGYHVTTANDGKTALSLFQADPSAFDIVVTDLTMPLLSGLDLSMAIKELNPVQKILLSTGNLNPNDLDEYKTHGVTGLLQKPWSKERLLEVLAKALEH